MKLNKLILSIWMGLSMVALVVGCSSSATDATNNNGAAPAEDGQYKMVMAGSSGYGTMMVDSENVAHSMLEMHFDTNQDGIYDIDIMTNGVDLKVGFTHSDGTTVKLAAGNRLEVKVPNHGTIVTMVEKFDGDGSNLELYTGSMGERESVFSNTNMVNTAISDSIPNRVELNKTIFNIILNTDNNTFKYITKGIHVNFFDQPGLTASEIEKAKQQIEPHQNEVAVGTYRVEGDIYTFKLGNREEKLKKVGNDLVMSEFQGLLCDRNYFRVGRSGNIGVGKKDIPATPPPGQTAPPSPKIYKVAGCPGIQGAYVDGYKAKAGEFYIGANSADEYMQDPTIDQSAITTKARTIEVYTKLTKQQ